MYLNPTARDCFCTVQSASVVVRNDRNMLRIKPKVSRMSAIAAIAFAALIGFCFNVSFFAPRLTLPMVKCFSDPRLLSGSRDCAK